MKRVNNIHPCDGGCWYCHDDSLPLAFSCEFDTFIHLRCLEEAVVADPNDREAAIIARELL